MNYESNEYLSMKIGVGKILNYTSVDYMEYSLIIIHYNGNRFFFFFLIMNIY